MRAVLVVITNVVEEKSLQLPFVHSNDMIQQLPPTAFDPALRHPVLPRTLERGLDRLNPEGSHGSGNLHSVLPVPVEDQKPRNRAKRKRLPQLLNNPNARGLPCDVAVQNTAAIMADDEEAVQYGENDRGNREEIHRGDGFPMVTQKGEPTLGWFWITGGSFHPAGNGPFGNIKTEQEKFSMDTGSSPAGVLRDHLEHQIPNFFRSRSSTDGLSDLRNHPPVPTEPGAVPSHDGFGRDDEECLFPA